MEQFGRVLMIMGGVIVVVGLLMTFGSRLPFRIGRAALGYPYPARQFQFLFSTRHFNCGQPCADACVWPAEQALGGYR